MKMRVLIVDDEPLARLGVTARLHHQLDVQVLAECGDGQQALKAIAELRPDLVFLDIQMPGLSGLELLKTLPVSALPSVVFLTAHEEYAVSAFEIEALDYLLKPIDDARFDACLARARRLFALKRQENVYEQLQSSAATVPSGLAPQYIRQFAVRRGATSTFVRVADVDWIEGLGDYAGLHVQDKTRLVRGPLSKLVARLDPIDFQRIHRSSIVQVDRIVRMESLFNRDLLVTLRDTTVLRVSRTYSSSLTDRLWNVTA